jgi:tRNA threonylcarbamoyl adenosine modification protein YjeE
MILTTQSENETIEAARDFATGLSAHDVILLTGDLGAGKSVFSRAIIRTLTGHEALDVPSPTFTLVQTYDTPKGEVYHFDLYRLKSPEELYEIGWEDALGSGLLLVEWPDKLGYLKPQKFIAVDLQQGDAPTSRLISIKRIDE